MEKYYFLNIEQKMEWNEKKLARARALYGNVLIITSGCNKNYSGPSDFFVESKEDIKKVITDKSLLIFDYISDLGPDYEKQVACYRSYLSNNILLAFTCDQQLSTEYLFETYKFTTGDTYLSSQNIDAFMKFVEFEINRFYEIKKKASIARQAVTDISVKHGANPVGRQPNSTIETSKAKAAKERIINESIDFNGLTKDPDLIKELGISRNTFYKYKSELKSDPSYRQLKLDMNKA